MTTKRVDEYSTATPAAADQLVGIDASDTTDAAAGSVKRFVLSAVLAYIESNIGTAAFRTLLDDASAAAMLTTLGGQPLDAELTALAGLTSAADKGIQFTGSGTAATFDLTTAGKALLDDAAASNQRTTLGLGTIATQDANNVSISGGSITGITDVALADGGTGASLSDPGADRILFWDDSAGSSAWLTAGSGLTITDTTITASGGAPTIFRASRSTTQNLTNSTMTKVQCDTETFDTGSDYDNATNYRWTPAAGPVQINGEVTFDHGTAFGNVVTIYKNGSSMADAYAVHRYTSSAGNTISLHVSISDSANGTDYYELWAAQYSGGDYNLTAAGFSGIALGG